jgi:hypothetical protein
MSEEVFKTPLDVKVFSEKIRSADKEWCSAQVQVMMDCISHVFPQASLVESSSFYTEMDLGGGKVIYMEIPMNCNGGNPRASLNINGEHVYWCDTSDNYLGTVQGIKDYIELNNL